MQEITYVLYMDRFHIHTVEQAAVIKTKTLTVYEAKILMSGTVSLQGGSGWVTLRFLAIGTN